MSCIKIFSSQNLKSKHVIIFLLFCIGIYYFWLNQKAQSPYPKIISVRFEWPIYWEYILVKAQKLQLILLDPEALKCLFIKGNKKKNKGCGGLFSQNVLRLGTSIKYSQKFIDILEKEVITNSNKTLKVHEILPSNDPDTIILNYTSPDNYVKQIIISFVGDSQAKNQNYYVLRGNKITPTISVRVFKTITTTLDNGLTIFVPEDIDQYLLFYKNGEFHQCNNSLAEKSAKKSEKLTRNILPSVVKSLSELLDIFIESGQIPFMAWGTLLGWYRDCGIIKHTQDLDFHILAGEYIDKFEETFINHPKFPARHKIAKKEYGLEYTLWIKYDKTKNTSIDFFYLYENDAKTQWSGSINLGNFERYKNTMPKLEGLCSADLYGHLFFIPCNYLAIITANYGKGWDSPYKGNKWDHVHKDGKWKDGVFTKF